MGSNEAGHSYYTTGGGEPVFFVDAAPGGRYSGHVSVSSSPGEDFRSSGPVERATGPRDSTTGGRPGASPSAPPTGATAWRGDEPPRHSVHESLVPGAPRADSRRALDKPPQPRGPHNWSPSADLRSSKRDCHSAGGGPCRSAA